jgi:hypothetical protein
MPKRVDYHNEDYDSECSEYDSAEESIIYNGYNNNGDYDSSDSENYEEEYDEYGNYIRPPTTPVLPLPLDNLYQEDYHDNAPDAPQEKWVVLSRPKISYSGSLPPWGWKSMPEYANLEVWPFEKSVVDEPIAEEVVQHVDLEQKPVVSKSIWTVAYVEKTDFTKLMMEEEAKQNVPLVPSVPPPLPVKQKVYSSSPKDPKVKSLLSRPTHPVHDQKQLMDTRNVRNDRGHTRNDHNNRGDTRNDRGDTRNDRGDTRNVRVDTRNDRVDTRNVRNDRNTPRARLLGNPKEKVIDNKEPPHTSTTTTSVEKRYDLICYNKEGHDISCKYVHNTEQWNPKICRFKENCQKIETCPFWHRERESKLEYISRSFGIKDSFFAKHKREFKAKYLS